MQQRRFGNSPRQTATEISVHGESFKHRQKTQRRHEYLARSRFASRFRRALNADRTAPAATMVAQAPVSGENSLTRVRSVFNGYRMIDTRSAIEEEIAVVIKESGRELSPITDSSSLMRGGVGLDSMDLAVLVVRLEQRLSCDPFNSTELEKYPTTVGELVRLYEETRARVASESSHAQL